MGSVLSKRIFKNRQFPSKESAIDAIREFTKARNLNIGLIEPHLVFRQIGDGSYKVSTNEIQSQQNAEVKPKPLAYLSNKQLAKDQLGLYRSYYPVEFGSNQKAKFIDVDIDDIELVESNQREENIQSLKDAIRDEVELPPPILDEDYAILDGHHRVIAAKELGIKSIPVIYLYEPD